MYGPARGGRLCEHLGGYKTINRIPLPLFVAARHIRESAKNSTRGRGGGVCQLRRCRPERMHRITIEVKEIH